MKFSVTYPMISSPYDPELCSKPALVRFARAAEAAGFDGIGFTDHPAPSQRWLDHGYALDAATAWTENNDLKNARLVAGHRIEADIVVWESGR